MFLCILFLWSFLDLTTAACLRRSYGNEKFVCVCNETFCDELNILNNVSKHYAVHYETNKAGARFRSSVLKFSKTADPGVPVLQVNDTKMFQKILGFGGAFTDAAGINIMSMSIQLQEQFFKSYYSDEGLQYNMGRVPMGSSDFSTHEYSYDDVPDDFELKNFTLAEEDFLYKIPVIHEANAWGKNELLLFATPWSAPAWMKTNNAMHGKASLKGTPGDKYYQTWANYFVRFLQEYQENNITFWGISTENEATGGCVVDLKIQCMCFPPEKQRDFLKLNLGPSLQNAGFGVDKLKVMIMDEARVTLPEFVEPILDDKTAAQFVSGIAFHWYAGTISPYGLLDITQQRYPNMFFLSTEACNGADFWEFPKVDLGSWERAERYAHDIIQDLIHWSVGWIDWNLALDMNGGPNWVNNFVDAPIIINAQANEFYKQPMYYALAQFSKCLPRGSYRIGLEIPPGTCESLSIAAFRTPLGKTVVIAVNRHHEDVNLFLQDISKRYLNITVSRHGIHSFVW